MVVSGNSALSTIEAIAHTAAAAGANTETTNTLLTLFHLQRHRVLTCVDAGKKAPRAIQVNGFGLGSWDNVVKCKHQMDL